MVTFKNNNTHRRNNFRRSDRMFKSGSDRVKIGNGYSNNENFQRKPVPKNINNISKLVEKYNNLAREALSSGDKILSENYFHHADTLKEFLWSMIISKNKEENIQLRILKKLILQKKTKIMKTAKVKSILKLQIKIKRLLFN